MLEHIKNSNITPKLYLDFLNKTERHTFTYVKEYENLFQKIVELKINGKYYINEIVLNGNRRKPYLDLEKIYEDEEECQKVFKTIIKKLQKDIITVFKKEYNEILKIDDILLLNSSGKVNKGYKLSLHIIIAPDDRTLYYTNSKFSNSSAFHLYTSLINLDAAYEDLLDPQVYNNDVNFRIVGSYKTFSDTRCLRPINGHSYKVIQLDQEEKLRYFLTYIKEPAKKLVTPEIEQTIIVKKNAPQVIIKNNPSQTDITKYLFMCVRKYHPTAIYNGLYRNVYHNFNYSNRKEICPISGKKHSGTNGFYVFETPRGYYMKCFSKSCKQSKHIGYADPADEFIDEAYQINKQYLIDKNSIKNSNELTAKLVRKWLNSPDIKTMAIKSPMGTGKTTLIKKILEYDKSLKNILWITHRQTLSKHLIGTFKDFGFKIYLELDDDSYFEYDRIIVQIDSIMRICKTSDNINHSTYKLYDLVIVDEIEGNLNHYCSPFLQKREYSARYLFNFMVRCITMARKLIVLDADMGIRTKLFIDHFGKAIVINNIYKPVEKFFTIINDKVKFNKKIFDDIKKYYNVCIISMSSNELERITDDKLKDELKDVNGFWKRFQVVLYSPTIESGVDFTVDHFDAIYCILKNGQMTCSQRAFLQMVGRIRRIAFPEIVCYYDGPLNVNSLIYTYDDILSYFRHYEQLNGKKIIEDIKIEDKIVNNEVYSERIVNISLFDRISIYNEVELLNKHPQMFMTILCKLIQRAGHQIKIMTSDKVKKIKVVRKNSLSEKLANIDETQYNLKTLLKKQAKTQLDATEKLALNKLFFMRTFGIRKIEDKNEFQKFHKLYYNKIIMLKRLDNLFGNRVDQLDGEYDNYNDGKDNARILIIVDLLNKLTGLKKEKYNIDDFNNITLDRNRYLEVMFDIGKNSLFFKNQEMNRPLFFQTKGYLEPINDKNIVKYMKVVQSLLVCYGIKFARNEIKEHRKKNQKRIYDYKVSIYESIKFILDYKKGRRNNVPGFNTLFKRNPEEKDDNDSDKSNIDIIEI